MEKNKLDSRPMLSQGQARAGMTQGQSEKVWIPVFAGMTKKKAETTTRRGARN